MFPYFIFLVIAVLIFHFEKKGPKIGFAAVLTILSMCVFAALRDMSVGTDTGSYVRAFQSFVFPKYHNFKEFITDEPGYVIIQYLCKLVTNKYWFYLAVVALISYSCIIVAIKKLSLNPVLSLFIFITLGYYTFPFNAARQGIALSIYVLAIPYIINKSFFKYVLIVLLASLFHKTAIVALPLYFFFNLKYSWKTIVIVLIGSILVSAFLPTLLSYGTSIDSRYAIYQDSGDGGELLTLFYVILSLFFICARAIVSSDGKNVYDVYLNMLLCGSTIYTVVILSDSYIELTRFAAYFQIASIFLWPELFNSNKKVVSVAFMYICIICHLCFFALYLSQMAGLVPYKMNINIL